VTISVIFFTAKSLKWESYEQTNLWSFITAELNDCPVYIVKCISFILDRLNPREHPESYMGLFNLLKSCTPSTAIFNELSKNLTVIDMTSDAPDWASYVQPDILLKDPYSLSHWMCTILSLWLNQNDMLLQKILSTILSKENGPSFKETIVHALDLIYFWFLYRQQRLISTNCHLIHSYTLISLIQALLHTHDLTNRYPLMEQFITQQGLFALILVNSSNL
jgi:hypothetical protein